jgi:deoxyribonuclease V
VKLTALHPWDLTPEEAIRLQQQLAQRIRLEDPPANVRTVAGVDVSFPRGEDSARAAVVVLEYPGYRLLEQVVHQAPAHFPYIPGLLSFREAPAILGAFERLATEPDLVVVDGQGIAHPRRLGIASHLGLWLDRPTIGCAKSRLTGYHPPVPDEAGAAVELRAEDGTLLGAVLRTRRGARPLYISPGHRITIPAALAWIRQLCAGYRLPEPTRQAHNLAGHSDGARLAHDE